MFNWIKTKFLNLFPHPKNVHESNRPLYIFGKIFGLVSYATGKNRDGTIYKVTAFDVIRCVLQEIVLAGLLVLKTVLDFDELLEYNMFSMLQGIQQIVTIALSIVDVAFSVALSRKSVEFFRNIHRIDRNLESIGMGPNYRSTYIHEICTIFLLISMMTALVIADGLTKVEDNYIEHHLFFILMGMPYIISLTVEIQYCVQAMMLKRRFEMVNKYLKTLLSHVASEHDGWATKTIKMSHISDSLNAKTTLRSIQVVDTVASFHIKLSDTATLLNKTFRVQLLFLIAILFSGTVTTLFIIVGNFQISGAGNTNWNFVFMMWVVSNGLQLTTIVYVTCGVRDEAGKCPRVMHRIRNASSDGCLNETIEMYSLQMHQNRLEFHVCGLFPLDYTLLYTIVAGVTTHLVILIQFNNAYFTRLGASAGNLLNATASSLN